MPFDKLTSLNLLGLRKKVCTLPVFFLIWSHLVKWGKYNSQGIKRHFLFLKIVVITFNRAMHFFIARVIWLQIHPCLRYFR